MNWNSCRGDVGVGKSMVVCSHNPQCPGRVGGFQAGWEMTFCTSMKTWIWISNSCKKKAGCCHMCLCNPSTGGRRERRRQILGTFWPASLAKMMSSRISERALHKEMMRKETGRDAWCAQRSRKTHQAYPHRTHNKWTDRWTEEDTSSHRTAMDGWMDE